MALRAIDLYLFPIDIEASFCPNPFGERAYFGGTPQNCAKHNGRLDVSRGL
jgi:hypothetical protein